MNPFWISLGGWFLTPLYHLHPCRRLGGWFLTPFYHPALAGTPPEEGNWKHLGGLFPTPFYHLHLFRRASMQAKALKVKNAISTLLPDY